VRQICYATGSSGARPGRFPCLDDTNCAAIVFRESKIFISNFNILPEVTACCGRCSGMIEPSGAIDEDNPDCRRQHSTAFALNSTGGAPQGDNMDKPGMSWGINTSGMKSGTTGLSKDGMAKMGIKQERHEARRT
jgi:hypothetical protein